MCGKISIFTLGLSAIVTCGHAFSESTDYFVSNAPGLNETHHTHHTTKMTVKPGRLPTEFVLFQHICFSEQDVLTGNSSLLSQVKNA